MTRIMCRIQSALPHPTETRPVPDGIIVRFELKVSNTLGSYLPTISLNNVLRKKTISLTIIIRAPGTPGNNPLLYLRRGTSSTTYRY